MKIKDPKTKPATVKETAKLATARRRAKSLSIPVEGESKATKRPSRKMAESPQTRSRSLDPKKIIEFNQKILEFNQKMISELAPEEGVERAADIVKRSRRDTNEDQYSIFLRELTEHANVSKACEAAGLIRMTAYNRKAADPEFAKTWDAHQEIGFQRLEEEAMRRGVEGVKRPVYRNGVVVGIEREYSDTMLNLLLRGRLRKLYGDKQEVTINRGGDDRPYARLNDEELDELIKQKLGGGETK